MTCTQIKVLFVVLYWWKANKISFEAFSIIKIHNIKNYIQPTLRHTFPIELTHQPTIQVNSIVQGQIPNHTIEPHPQKTINKI